MKIALLREEKVPVDKRVPLSPQHCVDIMNQYPGTVIVAQPSEVRAFKDSEYIALGIQLQEDLSDCDVLMGVKEVPKQNLIPGKTYVFFSHTHKMQPYNRALLQEAVKRGVKLVDYELITDASHKRLIGFGRYAGIVGTYNAFLAWGKKTNTYNLKPAHLCADQHEMESYLKEVILDPNFRVAYTGGGRVGGGAQEVLHKLGIRQVFPTEYLATKSFGEPVFTQLNVEDYNERIDGGAFIRRDFFNNPVGYRSCFMKYAAITDLYIPCHFWDNRSPYIFTREDAKKPEFKIKVVADISCDIDCAVASTLRASTIADPLYGYLPLEEKLGDFMDPMAIGVMAVDNLPCELPKDASVDFGQELQKSVIPYLLGEDPDEIIERATITEKGVLKPAFAYLQDFIDEKTSVA